MIIILVRQAVTEHISAAPRRSDDVIYFASDNATSEVLRNRGKIGMRYSGLISSTVVRVCCIMSATTTRVFPANALDDRVGRRQHSYLENRVDEVFVRDQARDSELGIMCGKLRVRGEKVGLAQIEVNAGGESPEFRQRGKKAVVRKMLSTESRISESSPDASERAFCSS
jgi:hypothetical protein